MQGLGIRAVILAMVVRRRDSWPARSSPFSGRWDLIIITSAGEHPAWMEFADEGGTPAVRIVGRTGSVHAVRNAKVEGTKLTFDDGPGQWRIAVKDRKLSGQAPDGSLEAAFPLRH